MEAVIADKIASDTKEFEAKYCVEKRKFEEERIILFNLIISEFRNAKILTQDIKTICYEIFNMPKDTIITGTTKPVQQLLNKEFGCDNMMYKLQDFFSKSIGAKCDVNYNFRESNKTTILELTVNKP